jgi:hypothetical protein
MFFNRQTAALFFPVILLFVLLLRFALLGGTPGGGRYHLRTEMPAAFFQVDTNSKRLSLDERIAWAYWEAAVMEVQWKYGYYHPLPPDPPAEFQIDATALGPDAADPATRMLYWHRLQRIWYLSETWQRDSEWEFGWLGNHRASK